MLTSIFIGFISIFIIIVIDKMIKEQKNTKICHRKIVKNR